MGRCSSVACATIAPEGARALAVPPSELPGNAGVPPRPSSSRLIVWDLEIAIPVEEVPGGWDAVRRGGAGVSCICLYDTASDRYHCYDAFTLPEAIDHLNEADLLIGFNTISFDTPIMESLTDATLMPPQFDILNEIWSVLPTRTKGYKLAQLCDRLGLGTKSRTGASAPDLYRTGQFGRLIDYCMNDVALTRRLANFMEREGHVLTPDGEPLHVSGPGMVI